MLTTEEMHEADAAWREHRRVAREAMALVRQLRGTPLQGVEAPLVEAVRDEGRRVTRLYELAHALDGCADGDDVAETVRLTQYNGLGL